MESINIGRTFHFGERRSLEVRAEFFNILNRLEINNATISSTAATNSPQTARTCSSGSSSVTVAAGSFSCPAGYTSPSGFGAISYTGLNIQPRNGQLVARFSF